MRCLAVLTLAAALAPWASALEAAPPELRQITTNVRIEDRFGRSLSNRVIPLLNWDGYMANPALELTVMPPQDATYPARVILSTDDPRLYFEMPSVVGPSGSSKVISFAGPGPETVRMAVFPSRGFHRGEHVLEVEFRNAEGGTTERIPIEVKNSSRFRNRDPGPVTVDFSRDRKGHDWFRGSRARVAEAAAADWAYFLDGGDLEEVPAGAQITEVWDHPRGFQGGSASDVENADAYTGFLLYVYGIRCEAGGVSCPAADIRSGGAPMASRDDQVQRRDGEAVEPRLWRSGAVDVEMDGNFDRDGWHESLDDTRWYELDTRHHDNDLYSVVMHEIGHALAFNERYEAFARNGRITSEALDAYFGGPVPVDGRDHFDTAVDPLSRYGAFGNDYHNEMPQGRWLITKLDLLLLEAVGHELCDVAALRELSIASEELPRYRPGRSYRARLEARNGVPPYRWTGAMPAGLDIDSFTGEISGTPISEAGRITFPVELCDQDPTSACETRRLALFKQAEDGGGSGGDNGGDEDGSPAPGCPPGQICAEPGTEPGECRICIPEGTDPP